MYNIRYKINQLKKCIQIFKFNIHKKETKSEVEES